MAQGFQADEYSYDAHGNQGWAHKLDAGTMNDTLGYAFDGAGRLVTIEPVSGVGTAVKPYTYRDYDNSGNMSYGAEVRKSSTFSSWVTSRSYHGADEKLKMYRRISSAPSGTRADVVDEYRYDALGRRVLVRSNHATNCDVGPAECFSAIQRMLWDGEQLVWELRNSGTSEIAVGSRPYGGKIAYVHGVGIDRPLGVLLGADSLIVPHVNWRGAYIGGTYANGNKVADANVSWMGATVRVGFEGGSLDGHWWGGLVKEQLDASGMLYRRNRYYDAATGRFSQIDPIGLAGGLNLYGFADGDPVNYSDPFGLCPPCTGSELGVMVLGPEKFAEYRVAQMVNRMQEDVVPMVMGASAPLSVAGRAGGLLARAVGGTRIGKALGYPNPVKPNYGGALQPYSAQTGQYLSKDFNPGLTSSPTANFTIGFSQGMLESAGGGAVDAPKAVTKAQEWGQAAGKIVGTILEKVKQ